MKRFFLFIPSLLIIFPSLFLFFKNKESVNVSFFSVLAALFAIGIAAFLCLLVIKFFIKDIFKAVIIASVAILAVFYYGYFFEIIKMARFRNFAIYNHREAILIWVTIILIAGFLLWRNQKHAYFLCRTIGVFVTVVFVVFFVFLAKESSGKIFLKGSKIVSAWSAETPIPLDYVNSSLGYAPDVYYIVPDGYANSFVLKEFFEYDNHEFLSYLEQKGFKIIQDSESNYPLTLYSLPTTLNMEYGDTLIREFQLSSLENRRRLIEENMTAMIFKNFGYKFVAITSDKTTFSGNKADLKFGPSFLFRLIIRPTIFDPFSQRFRNRILKAFDSFNKASAINSPKFVLAHIISPHDPYVFGPNGEQIGIHYYGDNFENNRKLYLDQIKFVNKKLEESIDVILKNSERTPVIIIQSDHGFLLPNSYDKEIVENTRFKNFSAFLLPKEAENLPASNINTFRFIFDNYFGTSFGQLENKKFYKDLVE
ncbi:MAG: hypothetical protein HYT36_02005 [Candidatus Staskawiczbacteria bacterium]|nr:hypothetical protein [Candidatus Staskawiczbacteria bacterium]